MTPDRRGHRAALVGATLGLVAIAVMTVIAFVSGGAREPVPQVLSTAAFTFVFAAPFLVALLARRVPDARARAGLLIGAGAVAVVLPVVTFSFYGMVIVPGGIVLIVAGTLAATEGVGGIGRLTGLVALVATIGVGSVAAFLGLREEACWYRVNGEWERRPFSTNLVLGPETNVATCGSHLGPAGIGAAVGPWVVVGAIAIVLGRERRTSQAAPA